MSKAYSPDDFDRDTSNVVPVKAKPNIGEAAAGVDLDRFCERTRDLINPPFDDDVDSEHRMSAIRALLREGATAEEVIGVLIDPDNKINHRRNAGKHIDEKFARREVEKALASTPKPADDFSDPVDPDSIKVGSHEAGRYAGVALSALMALRDPEWLVEGVLAENALFEIFGQFKAGKTFYGMELGLCIATGLNFFDVKTTQGDVLYVIAEGNRKMFGYRVNEWVNARADGDKKKRDALKALVEAKFRVVGVPVHMDVPDTVKAFILDNPGSWKAVFVDTLMRNMRGDPMKPADMIGFMVGCDRLRSLPCKPAVIFLHHMRRENGVGGYGPIIGEAFVDGAATVTRKGKERVFQVTVMRDADDSIDPWVCEIKPVNVILEMSDEGEKVRSVGVLEFVRRGGDPGQKVVLSLHTDEPKTIGDLVAATGIARRSLDRLLKKLRTENYVIPDKLKLTTSGIDLAQTLVQGTPE